MQAAWYSARPHLQRLPDGALVSLTLVFMLTLVVGNSTVAAEWVPGSDVLPKLALVAALLMAILALVPAVPAPLALGLGAALTPFAAYVASASVLNQVHPGDPQDPLGLAAVWWRRVTTGEAGGDGAFFLYLLSLVFWVVGGWLSWCTLRWRQPLPGIAPGAIAFATNVLNFPDQQNGYTLFFLVLTLGLLLWASYLRSLENTARRRVKLSGDARWDFWESGVVVTAAVIALGIFLPPASHTDRTVDIENGSFRGWAELEQRLNHPVAFGHGMASGNSIGFSRDVHLGGPLHRPGGVVFTYTVDGSYGGPRYFRGLDLDRTSNGLGGPEWRYSERGTTSVQLPQNTPVGYAEGLKGQQAGTFKVQMLKPPDRATDLLFYPGRLLKVDRAAGARVTLGDGDGYTAPGVESIERLSGTGKQGGAGGYKVTVTYSTATEDQLRAAGTGYPAWAAPYRTFGPQYRSRAVLDKVRDLALKVTEGKTNPYDQAQAIETFLRANYTYTLNPNVPPRDTDPLDYFLFSSKEGYCEYFATAMGDMLRSLGIPVRLVNGYGPGTFDEKLGRYVVKESDAHTWVEVLYPGYGWIPFEPTPDGTYFPIGRGSSAVACARDSEVCNAEAAGAGAPGDQTTKVDRGALDPGDQGLGGSRGGGPLAPSGLPWVLGALLLALAAAWLAVSRYLRPHTVNGVWRRLSLLSALAGVRPRPGETPIEFGARLGRELPETATPSRELAERFAVAAYAPRETAAAVRESVLDAWTELRPLLLRRLTARLRPAAAR